MTPKVSRSDRHIDQGGHSYVVEPDAFGGGMLLYYLQVMMEHDAD